MAEGAVGVMRHARNVGVRNGSTDERTHDLAGDLRVRAPGETGNPLGRKLRPRLRHVEAAGAGKSRERRVNEAESGGFASQGNVAHWMSWVADGGNSSGGL